MHFPGQRCAVLECVEFGAIEDFRQRLTENLRLQAVPLSLNDRNDLLYRSPRRTNARFIPIPPSYAQLSSAGPYS
jgi:hypothetical protein